MNQTLEMRDGHSLAFILKTEEFNTLGKDTFENPLKKKVISYILQDWLKISTLGVHTNYIVYLINNVYFNYPKYNLDKFIIQSFSREFGTLPINSS